MAFLSKMRQVIMIMKLIVWILMFVTSIKGYNMSYRLSSHHHERVKRAPPPKMLMIKYYYQNRVESVVLRQVLDTALEPNFLPIVSIQEDGEESERNELLGIDPTFYHGVNSFSAITYFPHTKTLHGVIDHGLYIDNLPLHNAGDPNLVKAFIHLMSNDFLEATEYSESNYQARQIRTNRKLEENTVHIPARSKNCQGNSDNNDVREILYPEILLAADVSSRIDNTHGEIEKYDEVIMYVLAYWNAVDMLFRHLKRTNMKINIAGVFVGTTEDVVNAVAGDTDYRVENFRIFIPKEAALDSLGNYFYKQEKMKRDSFDFLMWMTRATLIDDHSLTSSKHTGIAAPPANCGGLHVEELYVKRISNRAIVMHDDKYADYQLAARELAHLMLVSDDDVEVLEKGRMSTCLPTNPSFQSSGIMDPENKRLEGYLMWSYCSEIHFQRYANSISSCCLLNFPYRTMIRPKFPIQSLTVKRQCHCYGMQPPHQKRRYNICSENLKCKNEESQYIEVARPLDGTPCMRNGDRHFCCENVCV